MDDYKKIIEEIKANLTEDKTKNREYLLEQTEKYKSHPMSYEILKEIGRMLYDNLPPEDKENMTSAIHQDIDQLNKKIREANKYIMQKNFSKAKELLTEFLQESLSIYQEDQITRYFSFQDIIEFYCSKGVIQTDKKVIWIGLRYDIAYKLLGYIALEEKDFTKARDYLEKGLYYNPMSTEIRFEKAESYKMQQDLENMLEATKEIYDYLLNPNDLARYYRLLGYYYIERNQLELAYSLYAFSIYYANSEVAHHEIEYIKKQLGQPNYKLSTKDILANLEKEKITIGISLEKIAKLRKLSLEKELMEKQPDLVAYLNQILDKLTTPISPDKEIDGLEVSMPKITSEDIFDENKFILDDMDRARIQKNIEYLKQNKIPYFEDLKTIPINSNTKLRDKKEILDRALVDYVIASMSLYALDGKASSIPNILDEMDKKLQVKKILSDGDHNFLQAMMENKVSKQELQDVSWVFEECATLLWSLGFFDKPASNQECNVAEIDNLFFSSTYEDLLSKAQLRPKEEIMEFADLLFRYQWACRDARLKKQPLPNLKEMIVQEQRSGFEWLLHWKIESILKETIHTKYEKGDFNFEFDLPTVLTFSKTNSMDTLFTLTDSKKSYYIQLKDYGMGSSETLSEKFVEFKKNCEDVGKHILGEYELSAINLKGKIKQLIANKEVSKEENKFIGISGYYFVLNNHIVCLECVMLDTSIFYQDVDSIQNSKANSLMTKILFSILEAGSFNTIKVATDMANMMNYQIHAKQLYFPILDGFKVQEEKNPQILLTATNGEYIEMFTADGALGPNETFEQRIQLVNKNVMEFLKKQSPFPNENKLFYYEDATNGIFNYKVYVEDMCFEVDGKKKGIRQFIAYFLEPRFQDFYQLTVSTSAIELPNDGFKMGEVDFENDSITKALYDMLKEIMDKLRYQGNH